MTGLLEAGFGRLGTRFLIVLLLPVAVASSLSALVAIAATGHTPDDALRTWQHYGASGQLLITLGVALALVTVSYLLAFFQLPVLRVMEGYWPQLASLSRHRAERHRRAATTAWHEVQSLRDAGEGPASSVLARRLLVTYPPPTQLTHACLPTALGNRLRAAECYPLERYGIDAVVIWPRLRPLLPPEMNDRVAAARTGLDGTVSWVFLSLAFGIVWPVALLAAGGPGWLAALCLLAWPVAWAAYRAALVAASAYGGEVCVAFDLYQALLPRHLELDKPGSPVAERRQWDDLAQFYLRNLPLRPLDLHPPQCRPPVWAAKALEATGDGRRAT